VFDLNGNYVRIIGWDEGIKTATGLKVTDSQIIIADFEGSRVLVYDLNGKLLQTLSNKFNLPTDIETANGAMYVINYKGKTISVFERQ